MLALFPQGGIDRVSWVSASEVTIIDVPRSTLYYEGRTELRDVVTGMLATGSKIVLNLSEVETLGGVGVGELCWALDTIRHDHGQVKLANVHSKLRAVLDGTRLSTNFEVQEHETAAIESFGSA